MTPKGDYGPCFGRVPDDWSGRWELLREFTRRWHGVNLGGASQSCPRVAEEESKLGLTLPPSFREWIRFADELMAQRKFGILRDRYEVTRLKDHPAISLMIQGEADCYWAVKEAQLADYDPPVDAYFLDYGSTDSDRFALLGPCSPRLTGFVLDHMSSFLYGRGGGCSVDVEPTDAFLVGMREAFPVCSRFDDLWVFERPNIFALVTPDPPGSPREGGFHLCVEIWKPIPRREVPPIIFEQTRHGGAFHGMLVPE